MADFARKLPKWQAQQILCQTLCQIGTANLMPKKIIFFADFFYLLFKFGLVKYRYKRKKRKPK